MYEYSAKSHLDTCLPWERRIKGRIKNDKKKNKMESKAVTTEGCGDKPPSGSMIYNLRKNPNPSKWPTLIISMPESLRLN